MLGIQKESVPRPQPLCKNILNIHDAALATVGYSRATDRLLHSYSAVSGNRFSSLVVTSPVAHSASRRRGSRGGGTAPLVGPGAKAQKPAIICTYNNQLYNGNCYSCTQLSILHFVKDLLEPACAGHVGQRVAQGWNQELTCLASLEPWN